MKREESPTLQINPSQKRVLAFFSRCDACNCAGWRRHAADDYPTDEDLQHLANANKESACTSCNHTLSKEMTIAINNAHMGSI
jgi:hypothetical protein